MRTELFGPTTKSDVILHVDVKVGTQLNLFEREYNLDVLSGTAKDDYTFDENWRNI
jgi:hypothetical protein